MSETQDITPPAVVELLRGLIDYAGFYPPAGLSVEQAFKNCCQYEESDFYWVLGHLVLPVGKLPELASLLTEDLYDPLRVSVVMPAAADIAGFSAGLELVRDFNDEHEFNALVNVIECKVDSPAEFTAAHAAVRDQGLVCFWELPLNDHLNPLIETLAKLKRETGKKGDRAKIRTGGIVPGAIPSVESVANFISVCAQHQVAFKATAGLHHPIRSSHPLTYAPDAPRDVMHGFLNLFIAVTAAYCGTTDVHELITILRTENSSDFQVESHGIRWRERFWTVDQISDSRYDLGSSFGSCSFVEPVQDLQTLGWLPLSDESFSE